MLEEVTGKTRDLILDKLRREGYPVEDSDSLQWGVTTVFSGGCPTCWSDWDEFQVLLNGEIVYWNSGGTEFQEALNWILSE